MSEQSGKQYLAAFVVNLYMLGYGIFNGWNEREYDYHFERLRLDENFNWNEYESSSFRQLFIWFIGPFVGSIFFGVISMKFGKKVSLLYMPIPMIMSCLLNMFVREFTTYKISMVLAGLYGSICIVGPLYLIDVLNDRFRGAILTSLVFAELLGEMLAFGGYFLFDNNLALLILIPLTVIAAILIYRLPETPLSLIKMNKFEEAERSIRFYKNIRPSDDLQMERLKQEFDRVKHVATDGDLEANQMNPLQWADFKTKHARRVFAIGIVLVVLNICNSNTHLALHSAVALTRYPINMQIDGGIWIVSIVALLGSYVGLQLVDRVGRKILIIVSAVTSFLALIEYSVHMLLFPPYNQTITDSIPAITSLLAIFFGALGIRSLTFTVSTEIMPEKIKDVGVIFCGAFYWLFSYIFHAIFYSGREGISQFISAVVCLIGAVIIYFILPETKGKSRQEIMRSF